MGSGSFLVAALRYLVAALYRSLEHHGRIARKGDRETVVTLPFGTPARGEPHEELFDLPPEDDRFGRRLRARLARHVVERCLYGVDLNPMAVELARLALWVETLDRDLPFEYLDHKLKVGNSLVGCWLHLVEDYPVRALDREGGDGSKGERTKWLKRAVQGRQGRAARAVIDAMGGASSSSMAMALPVDDLVASVRARFEALHELPRDELEPAYRELLEARVQGAQGADGPVVCALVLAAGRRGPADAAEWRDPTHRRARRGRAASPISSASSIGSLSSLTCSPRSAPGFDAVLGNPPWETVQARESRVLLPSRSALSDLQQDAGARKQKRAVR